MKYAFRISMRCSMTSDGALLRMPFTNCRRRYKQETGQTRNHRREVTGYGTPQRVRVFSVYGLGVVHTRALNQGREYWYIGSTLARSEMAKYSRLARKATGRYLRCTRGTPHTHTAKREGQGGHAQ